MKTSLNLSPVCAAGLLVGLSFFAGCGAEDPRGTSISSLPQGLSDDDLSGCRGVASSVIPTSGDYFLTTFGGPGESQPMSCGSHTKNGTWYYAASRQRYGCGSRIKLSAGGKCVVVQTDDYGPDVCVEKAAGGPIIDASPLVGTYLFGSASAGWSDHFKIKVTTVSKTTPLGPGPC